MISITLNKQLKITFNSTARDILILFHYWQKFKNWLQDIMLHKNSDKLKLLKKFTVTHQFLKENLNQFYLRLFNLKIQSEHMISIENYCIRLLKSLQNLMNQHDHEYSIIQHVIIHADKLWQILDREKICLELKKEKNKIQQCNKNFNQHCHNNSELQD